MEIWTDLDGFEFKSWMYIRKDLKISIDVSQSQKIFKRCQGDINFHLQICINIQFHGYGHLKYQFVCKYMKK